MIGKIFSKGVVVALTIGIAFAGCVLFFCREQDVWTGKCHNFSPKTLAQLAKLTKDQPSVDETEVVKLLGEPDYMRAAGPCSSFGTTLVWWVTPRSCLRCNTCSVVQIPGFPRYASDFKMVSAKEELPYTH